MRRREHLHEDLSLAELAHCVGVGSRQLTRLFRRAFGTTPHRYVMQQRLDEAARLLKRGKLSIAEIAIGVGFANQSHFSDAFRKAFGVPPRRYAQGERRGTSRQ